VKAEGDDPTLHFLDTVRGSDWGADQEVARIFAEEAPVAVRELAHWGVPWTRVRPGKNTYFVQGKPGREEERQWLTGDTNIVEMKATLLYTVEDPVAFLFGGADLPDGRPKYFVLRKVGESVLSELVATMPIDDVLSSGKQELSRRALREVQAAVADLGLGLRPTALNIIEVTPPSQGASARICARPVSASSTSLRPW